jgi:hypothetical protein
MPRGGDAMDQTMTQVVAAGAIELLALPILLFVVNHVIGKRLDDFDRKRDDAREERAERERREAEQREAERSIVLAIARSMLLDNYEKCMKKGYYTLEEREVYGKLFAAYEFDGGNGVIGSIAPQMRELPMEPPRNLDGTTLPKGGKQ